MEQEHQQPESPVGKAGLNTVLLGIVIAVSGFLSVATVNTLVSVGRIEAAQITRTELDTKISEVRMQQQEMQKDLVKMQLDIAHIRKETP